MNGIPLHIHGLSCGDNDRALNGSNSNNTRSTQIFLASGELVRLHFEVVLQCNFLGFFAHLNLLTVVTEQERLSLRDFNRYGK